MDPQYGPQRPGPLPEHTDHRIVLKPGRHARKIRADLEKTARLYDGVQMRLFSVHGRKERCPDCTNMLTGAVMSSTCESCGGTGYTLGFEYIGDFWTKSYFNSRVVTATENGNTDNPGIRDQIVVIGAPLIKDQDLLITIQTKEVFKVVDQEPQIVAAGGEIITQVASCSRLTPGSREYKLINW